MTKIRKQPKRNTKKTSHSTTRNIFIENHDFENTIPKSILMKLSAVTEISVNVLE